MAPPPLPGNQQPVIIIKKRRKRRHAAHHGGAWKVAYADFVTAMMAFFLLMWLINTTSPEQKRGIADYFAPASVSETTSGSGGILAGTALGASCGPAPDAATLHALCRLQPMAMPFENLTPFLGGFVSLDIVGAGERGFAETFRCEPVWRTTAPHPLSAIPGAGASSDFRNSAEAKPQEARRSKRGRRCWHWRLTWGRWANRPSNGAPWWHKTISIPYATSKRICGRTGAATARRLPIC